jgi:hypothetical protein
MLWLSLDQRPDFVSISGQAKTHLKCRDRGLTRCLLVAATRNPVLSIWRVLLCNPESLAIAQPLCLKNYQGFAQ